jgi:heptose I phosphotransferase
MRETFWRRLTHGTHRLRERPEWAALSAPNWLASIMSMTVTDRFHAKQGRSTARWSGNAKGAGRAVYLKRHYRLAWWHGWLAAIWPDGAWSPALQEWNHLEWARRRGFPVPKPVAAAEYIGPWGRLQSFIAVEELTGMVPLHEAVPSAAASLPAEYFQRWKRGLIAEIARLTRGLHDRRRFHKDLYLCHFFIRKEDVLTIPAWAGRVHLIDLHRLARHSWTWRLWQIKDLGQLLYSSVIPGVGARDRLRFWRDYLGHRGGTRTERWLRRMIVAKWRRYRRHNRKNLARPIAA